MQVKYNEKFRNEITEIFVGEYYVTNKNEIISTLLGSCISICLMDEFNRVFGMNHFLLPCANENDANLQDKSKFGNVSVDLLISKMENMGAKKENFVAKVFGGGRVLKSSSSIIQVNEHNISFINMYLEEKNIPIASKDVGGDFGRMIYFNTIDGSVYVKKI